MSLLVAVQIEVGDTLGATHLRVQSSETVQMPGTASLMPKPVHGDLLVQVVERMTEEALNKAREQSHQMFEAAQ